MSTDRGDRWVVEKHGSRWTLLDLANPYAEQPIYATYKDAQASADRRNKRVAK